MDQDLKKNEVASFSEEEWIAFVEKTSKQLKKGKFKINLSTSDTTLTDTATEDFDIYF